MEPKVNIRIISATIIEGEDAAIGDEFEVAKSLGSLLVGARKAEFCEPAQAGEGSEDSGTWCDECGKNYKNLARHLKDKHGIEV